MTKLLLKFARRRYRTNFQDPIPRKGAVSTKPLSSSLPVCIAILHPSWLQRGSTSCIYVAAVLAIVTSGAPTALSLLLFCAVTFQFIFSLRYWRSERKVVRQLVWHQSGKVEYFLLRNPQQPDSHFTTKPVWHGWKDARTTDNGLVIVLHVRPRRGQIEKIIIWRDAVSPTEYRQIRARIRLFQFVDQIH